MHVIIVDTNIIISSIIGKSYPLLIVRSLILQKKVICTLSEEILKEYKNTISSKKFSKIPNFTTESEELVEEIRSASHIINPNIKVKILKDSDGDKFLELAFSVDADFLITGNTKHFPFGKFQNTEIISPANYWKKYWNI